MNRLYLLRHGIAVPHGTPGYEEDDRPLTPKGEKRVRQVGQGLKRLKIKPDTLLTSPLQRARKTAEIVAEVLGVAYLVEVADELRADRSAATIRDWVVGRSEASVMLVGHDPAFSELVGLLATGQPGPGICQLRKGGLAAFRAQPDGRFQLDWLLRPGVIRRLAD